MHELSLAEALWTQAERLRREHGGVRVVAVRVGVGALAGVEPESLQSAFALLLQSTGAGGARLEIQQVPLEARCEICGAEFPVHGFHFVCPACNANQVTVLRGEDLILQEITLESREEADE
jgi:hydrogenase nickel incorporation protein HypA/HybF